MDKVYESIKKERGVELAPCFVDAALEIKQEIRDILESGREEAYRKAYAMYL